MHNKKLMRKKFGKIFTRKKDTVRKYCILHASSPSVPFCPRNQYFFPLLNAFEFTTSGFMNRINIPSVL